MPIWRKLGKRVLDYATSFANGGIVTDSQCGFRAFNRRAVENITPRLNGKDFSVESEQLVNANDTGLKVGQTSIMCKYKGLDTSTKTPTTHGISVLRYIIWLIAERHPLIFIGIPGFFMVLFGLILGIYTLQYYNQTHVFVIPYAILVSIFMIVGFLALFMSLVLNVLPNIINRSRKNLD
jgi:hypothetical protein